MVMTCCSKKGYFSLHSTQQKDYFSEEACINGEKVGTTIRVSACLRICVSAYLRICVSAYLRICVSAYLRICVPTKSQKKEIIIIYHLKTMTKV
jgi:hypothetical protein